MFFAFFYTAIVFNPTETADNLKKHGGFIPGIRPGERTAEYIDYVLVAHHRGRRALSRDRLPDPGNPDLLRGGAVLFRRHLALIVVSVTMDTVAQIQGYLLAHQYEGLIKRSKLRGSRR